MGKIVQFINQVRYQNKLRAAYGIDGENPIPTVAELVPVVIMEGERFELRFPGNEFSYIGGVAVAAGGAGNASNIALLNPTGSGQLVVVEKIDASILWSIGAVAESVILASYTQAPANVITRDFRGFGPAAQIWTRNNAVPVTERARMHGVGLNELEFCIAPGQAMVVWGTALNVATEASYVWRERGLDYGTK